jgi:SRSO17 transposase
VAPLFRRADLRRQARDYVRGLLGPVGRKNCWQLAEFAGQKSPGSMQSMLARGSWDADAVRDVIVDYIGERLGPGGVLIVDDTGFIRKGLTSAGVARQYTGTSGKVDNCQIGVFAAYATNIGRALVDRELYLPKCWTGHPDRCAAAGVPDHREFATKPQLARRMILRCLAAGLPADWVAADEAFGMDWRFRRMLEELEVGYVLAVPKSQNVPRGGRIETLISRAPEQAWVRLSAGDGAKGPRLYDWAAAGIPLIPDFDIDPPTHRRWVLARRSISEPTEYAYYLAYAPFGTTVAELVRVAGMRWSIEDCFGAAKNECGLDEYEVRRYTSWYRHITLAMLAFAFLAVLAADAADAAERGGTAVQPMSSTTQWQKSDGCWELSFPNPGDTGSTTS